MRIFDDELGYWVEVDAAAPDDAPMSPGQALAILVLVPFVLIWWLGTLGIDPFAPLFRLVGGV